MVLIVDQQWPDTLSVKLHIICHGVLLIGYLWFLYPEPWDKKSESALVCITNLNLYT